MKLTILGNNGPYPSAGGACSGYLIEDKNTKILLDCGNGVISNLQKIINIKELDAIIITHLHNDHVGDIFVLKYAFGIMKQMGDFDKKIMVYTASDDKYLLSNMNYNDVFEIIKINDEKEIIINDINISFNRTIHPVETYSVKLTKGDKKFVYSSDTSYNENIIEFSKGVDLLLIEAGVLEKDRLKDTPHLSAKQAGVIVEKANVKRALLTHLWPEYNQEEVLNEALENCNINVEIARLMEGYNI